MRWARVGILTVAAVVAVAGCGTAPAPSTAADSRIEVVAAENFWGSIAAQVGGDHVHLASIIVNPNTDPHDFEPTPADARLMAGARYVILNGVGYDSWGPKLVDANPVAGRKVLTIGDLAGKKEGDNPHLWYSPAIVGLVIDKVASDLSALAPADAAYFDRQRATFKSAGLKDYNDTIATIQGKYHGTPVGASESIVSYLAVDLGLNLVTPSAYLKAISDGTDPSPADKADVQQEISDKQIRVFVYNSQNSTPDVQALVAKAKANEIPVVQVTETLSPATATFQEWQVSQLMALLAALGG